MHLRYHKRKTFHLHVQIRFSRENNFAQWTLCEIFTTAPVAIQPYSTYSVVCSCCSDVVMLKHHSKSTPKSKVTHIKWWTFHGLYFLWCNGACEYSKNISTAEGLERNLGVMSEVFRRWELKLNWKKTKVMRVARQKGACEVRVGYQELEQVDEMKYLGVVISADGSMEKKLRQGLQMQQV